MVVVVANHLFYPLIAAHCRISISADTDSFLTNHFSKQRSFELIHEGGEEYPEGEPFFRLYQNPSSLLIACDTLGEFKIDRSLKTLTYWRHPQCLEDEFTHYCQSAISAIVLELHGYLAVHGSSYADSSGTTLILGESGAGKSTAAAQAALKGALILNDDITPVLWDEGEPMLIPGISKVKVQPIVANRLLCSRSDSFPGLSISKKQEIFFTQKIAKPAPLTRVFFATESANGKRQLLSIAELDPSEILQLLVEHSYISPLVQPLGIEQSRFFAVTRLVDWICQAKGRAHAA